MTFQQINYFITACRHGNISRAAEDFGISQPSISSAIKNLENEFGVLLIKRRQTGFVLTADGEAFRRLAETLVAHADSVQNVMRARGRDRRVIRLGMPPMASAVLFPEIYAGFCSGNPDIELVTQEAGREQLLQLFEDNLLDLAFLPHAEPFPEGFVSVPVKCFETVCCMSKDNPLATRECLTPKDLENEPLVLFARGFFQTGRVLKAFSQEGVKPQIMHTSSQLSTVQGLIAGGVATGFLFRELAELDSRIASVPLSPAFHTQISLVMRDDCYVTHAMQRFIDYIRTTYAEQSDSIDRNDYPIGHFDELMGAIPNEIPEELPEELPEEYVNADEPEYEE